MREGERGVPFFDDRIPFDHGHAGIFAEHPFAPFFAPPSHKVGEMVFTHGARSGRGIALVRASFYHTSLSNHAAVSFSLSPSRESLPRTRFGAGAFYLPLPTEGEGWGEGAIPSSGDSFLIRVDTSVRPYASVCPTATRPRNDTSMHGTTIVVPYLHSRCRSGYRSRQVDTGE